LSHDLPVAVTASPTREKAPIKHRKIAQAFPTRRLVAALLASAMLLPFSTLQAAEMYKVVDEEGKVTFSQFPPSKPQGEVEKVTVAGASDAMTTLTKNSNLEFCSDIELPTKDNYRRHPQPSDRFLRDVGYKRKAWQQKLEGVEQRFNESMRHQNSRSSAAYNPQNRYRPQQGVEQHERQEAQLSK
jgi:hypothetical protein